MLSRKHYRVIAKAIKDNTINVTHDTISKEGLINDLCVEFKNDNELFNKQTFVDACDFGCDDECDFK